MGIYYVPGSARDTVLVPITKRPAVAFGTPADLPHGLHPGLVSGEPRGYDILADGRFISLAPASVGGMGSAPTNEIRVMLNWFEELKRLVPTK